MTTPALAQRIALLVALVCSLVAPRSVLAHDVWTDPYPGVRHLHRTTGSQDVHLVFVDMSSPHVSIVSTRPRDRGLSVREFAARYGADIAINANYFDNNLRSCGLAMGDGEIWDDAYHDGCEMSVAFGSLNQATAFDSYEMLRGPTPATWVTDAVSGKPWLIRHGVIQGGWRAPRHIEVRHPRTAVGLTEDRRTLVLLVAEGRRPGVPGLDGYELAQLFAQFHVHDALNLDGGGSSELVIGSEGGVINHPSDGRARILGNHLGIRVRPGVEWFSARLEEENVPTTLLTGNRAVATLRVRNTGRAAWGLGDEGGARLVTRDRRSNAFFDPDSWVTTSTLAILDRVVEPGEEVTLRIPVSAPARTGALPLALGLQAADGAEIRGVSVSREIRVNAPIEALAALPRAPEAAESEVVVAAANLGGSDSPWHFAIFGLVASFIVYAWARTRRNNTTAA